MRSSLGLRALPLPLGGGSVNVTPEVERTEDDDVDDAVKHEGDCGRTCVCVCIVPYVLLS